MDVDNWVSDPVMRWAADRLEGRYNECHNPSGPEGGQFCGGGKTKAQTDYEKAYQKALAEATAEYEDVDAANREGTAQWDAYDKDLARWRAAGGISQNKVPMPKVPNAPRPNEIDLQDYLDQMNRKLLDKQNATHPAPYNPVAGPGVKEYKQRLRQKNMNPGDYLD